MLSRGGHVFTPSTSKNQRQSPTSSTLHQKTEHHQSVKFEVVVFSEEEGPAAELEDTTEVEEVELEVELEVAVQIEVEDNVEVEEVELEVVVQVEVQDNVVVEVVEVAEAGGVSPFPPSLALGPEQEELDEEAESASCSPSTDASSPVRSTGGSYQTP